MNSSAGNNHAQTPCPENHRFGGSKIQTSNTANRPYVSTAAQTTGVCLDGQQQIPSLMPGNMAPG